MEVSSARKEVRQTVQTGCCQVGIGWRDASQADLRRAGSARQYFTTLDSGVRKERRGSIPRQRKSDTEQGLSDSQTEKAGRRANTRKRPTEKIPGLLETKQSIRFKFLSKNLGHLPVKKACKIIGVSRSGYYEYQKRKKSNRQIERETLAVFIGEIFARHNGRYGARRIAFELTRIGIPQNDKRVGRIMRELGLFGKGTTRKHRKGSAIPDAGSNLLNRKFEVGVKNKVWMGDITYIPTKEGFLYLSTLLDLHSRKVVGWTMAKRMSENLAIDAFKQAYEREQPDVGLLVHTDLGSQFTSKRYNKSLKDKGCIHSYSRKGNPYDNAVMESFYRTLKRELLNKKEKFADRLSARQEIFKYIELYYNIKRAHSSLGYLSPREYERANAQ